MKKPIAVISTDIHIKVANIDLIIDLFKQKIELANELGVNELYCLGDIFQSRQAQPLSVLKCFEAILDMIHAADMKLYCIPGNHDKTSYSSVDSFLDQFQWHPALELVREMMGHIVNNLEIVFIPYFEEKRWLEEVNSAAHLNDMKMILMSHQALTGSVNNDGSTIDNGLKSTMFAHFYKVFLGHYHNAQQIGKNIYHLPSICANNFGEDNAKGFTVLYDSGDHEHHQSIFPQYQTVKIDLDTVTKQEVNQIKVDYAQNPHNIRFEFTGSEEKVKSLNKEEFTSLGIDVTRKDKEIDAVENVDEHVQFTQDSIKVEFKSWCKTEGKNHKIGSKYINRKLK